MKNEKTPFRKQNSRLVCTITNRLQGPEKIADSTNTPQKRNPLIPNLVEDMTPVVVVRDDFASRDKAQVIAFFGFFPLSRF